MWQGNPLLLPTFFDTARAFFAALQEGLIAKAWVSLGILLQGYAIGVVLALLLTSLAISFQLGRDLLGLLTAMLNPLPAIALLPVAMLWFGIGEASLIFVLVHAVCTGPWRSAPCRGSPAYPRRYDWSGATTRWAARATSSKF